MAVVDFATWSKSRPATLLREKLCPSQSQTYNHRVALFGLGGVGKTQAAVEYVFKYQSKYRSTFWISAVTLADLQTGFEEIAAKTKCVTVDQKDAASTAKAVLQWLEQQTSWLLVLDNLDEISIVDGYLPDISSGNGPLLITTRNQDPTGILAQGLEVEVFDPDDAVDLLLLRATGTKESQPETHSVGAEIVAELGYLPLAIEHAAAFIRQSLPDISKFLDTYSKSRKRFLEHIPKQNYAYSRAVAATFLLSFDAVKKINPNAAELLTLFAFLNPDGILIDFLQDGRNGLDDPLKTLVGDSFGFGVALADLGQYSLIRQSNADQTISVHRLVQAVIRDNLEPDRKTQFMKSTVSLFLLGFPHFEEDKRELCRRYQAQVDGPLQTLFELGTENVAKMSIRFALFLDADGKASACESFERIAAEIQTNVFGAEHPDTLTSMDNLAGTYLSLGRMKEAAELYEKVLEKRRRILGAEHPDTLTSMSNLASTYGDQGRMGEAAALKEEVLEKRRRILGAENPDTLASMNNLALTYWAQGRTGDAAALQEEVLEKRRRILGAEHPDTLTSMNNLTVMYAAQGRTGEAAALKEEVLEKRRRILGAEHPDTLTSMGNLAFTYRAQGRMAEAAALEEEVLEKRRRILGAEHPDTLRSMNNLAVTYADQGRTGEAAALQEEVLEKWRQILGAEHPDTLTSMTNLASTYSAQGRMREAVALEEEVLEKRRRILGEEHPDTMTSMTNLALTYGDQGRTAEAAALEEEVLEKRRRILGVEHPNTLTSMGNLAFTYRAQGRMAEAAALEEEVLETRRRTDSIS